MASVLSRLVQGNNPLVSSVAALAGGAAGGGIYLSLPGAVFGLVIALSLCALLSILAAATGLWSDDGEPAPEQSGRPAMTAASPVAESAAVAAEAATETEAQLMDAGRYAEYHLAKAKRHFAAGNFKEAAYQASASLSHGGSAEARELKSKAQASMKA